MRVLVADDEAPNVLILKKLLEKDSHEVHTATNGIEAVDIFTKVQPDIILMDVMMPLMDGYEATQAIKEKADQRHVPIIFITALKGDEALIKSLEAGADDFISKPFSQAVLRAKIGAAVRVQTLANTLQRQNEELLRIHNQSLVEQKLAEQVYSDLINKGVIEDPIIHALHKPADLFNGDIILAVRSPRGGINILVGDFTGHGLAPALCAIPVVEVFYKMTSIGFELPAIINEINKKICGFLPKGKFLAACFFHVNAKNRYLQIWNGGMPDVYVFNSQQGIKSRIHSNNLPLGIIKTKDDCLQNDENMFFEFLKLDEGDRIFAYSDGVIELCNGENQQFSQARLEQVIVANRGEKDIVSVIEKQLSQFVADCGLQDDVTMFELICCFDEIIKLPGKLGALSEKGSWAFDIKFDASTLQYADPLPVVLTALSDVHKGPELQILFYIVAEMLSNALEHGLLHTEPSLKESGEGVQEYNRQRSAKLKQLNQGRIKFSYSYNADDRGGTLTLTVEDSGKGFDIEKVLNELKKDHANQRKGLMVLNTLCHQLAFDQRGSRISASFFWEN